MAARHSDIELSVEVSAKVTLDIDL